MARTRRPLSPGSLNPILDVVGGIYTWMDAAHCGSRNAAATVEDVRLQVIEWTNDQLVLEPDPDLPVYEDGRITHRSNRTRLMRSARQTSRSRGSDNGLLGNGPPATVG